jgi:AraC family transcriptional regulator
VTAKTSGQTNPVLPHATHTGTPLSRFISSGWGILDNVYLQGHHAESHAHESPFLAITVAGHSMSRVSAAEVPTGAGDIHFIPAGWNHSHRAATTVRAVTIDILPGYADALGEMGANLKAPALSSHPKASQLAEQLRAELLNPDPLSPMQIDAIIMELSVLLIRNSRREGQGTAPGWLERLVRDVQDRYRDDITLNELAAEARVHPVHVSRAFRKHYGETLGAYVRRLRIREARRLLESTSRPIRDVAVEVGYHDESHFARAFKDGVGATPGHYRRILRQSATFVY